MTRSFTGERRQEEADAHLDADVLELLGLLQVNGDTADSIAGDGATEEAAHVAACDACRLALEAQVESLRATRETVGTLVDDTFTDAALEQQRQAILDQLSARRDGGRVLAFPARQPHTARRDRPAMRWLAAAAAAGLLVGMLAGQRLHPLLSSPIFGPGHETAVRFAGRAPVWRPDDVPATDPRLVPAHDELFLSEMETAVNNRGAVQLRALDDLTPEPVTGGARSPR